MFSVPQQTLKYFQENQIPFWFENKTTSTNDIAKQEALSLQEPLKCYLTQTQTKGRGRGTRRWEDSDNESYLLMTFSFQMPHPPQPIATPIYGLALYQAVQKIWPQAPWSLKAPNDLYLHDKKVAGLLLESVSQGDQHRLIVGLGLNVFEHPQSVSFAGHLSATIKSLSESQWSDFLKELFLRFQEATLKATQKQLTAEDITLLLKALNDRPNIQSPILDITPEADLITASARISWQSL
ncbi:MAG: biotin synthetase [Bdellovibrio sp.]|nr:MAG: biotin synthetase [Bdellovibrio sp.]